MIAKLHQYQNYCIEFLEEHPRALLLLEPGLGKTLITLTHLSDLKMTGELGKVLIIAPLNVAKHTWSSEIKKWETDLSYSLVLGDAKARVAALERPADVYITNKENVPWLVAECAAWPFDTVIIDELSAFKAPNTTRFKAIKKVRSKIKTFIGLTGTPAPNSLLDIWPQVFIADGGERLGKFITRYRDIYFKPGKRNGHIVYEWKLKDGAEDAIHKKISDIAISMRSKDHLDLPPRIDNNVELALDPKVMTGYQKFARDLVLGLPDGEVTALSAAVLANKLMQYANGAVYHDEDTGENRQVHKLHTAKLDALKNIIDDAQGQQVLVFYAYQHDVDRIRDFIPHAEALDVDRFTAGEQQIALAHPASAGHGLNLQVSGAHIIVWFGMTWSLELYQQANARLDRQGQINTVVIHHLVAKGTIDERALQVLSGKEQRQDALMEAVKAIAQPPKAVL